MGYTHYMRQQRDFTASEWEQIRTGFRNILNMSDIAITGGDGEPNTPVRSDDEVISFNGVDDDSHETFWIDKNMQSDFEFCKTARKPYDEVVVATLCLIDSVASGVLEISSNGDMNGEEWEAGRGLYKYSIL